MKNILCLLLPLLLLACSAPQTQTQPLTPLPKMVNLSDAQLKIAIQNYIRAYDAPPNSAYDFVRVDLNKNGKRDALVLFKLPHSYWCGWDGCGLVVFQARGNGFTPLSTIKGVRGPVYVSQAKHKGWRDIIVRISGASVRDKNVILAFDGRSYPDSPALSETLNAPVTKIGAQKFFQ